MLLVEWHGRPAEHAGGIVYRDRGITRSHVSAGRRRLHILPSFLGRQNKIYPNIIYSRAQTSQSDMFKHEIKHRVNTDSDMMSFDGRTKNHTSPGRVDNKQIVHVVFRQPTPVIIHHHEGWANKKIEHNSEQVP